MITRRGLLTSILVAAAAPSFIRHAMPIRVLDEPQIFFMGIDMALGGGHDAKNANWSMPEHWKNWHRSVIFNSRDHLIMEVDYGNGALVTYYNDKGEWVPANG